MVIMNLRTPDFPLVLDNSTNDVQNDFFVPALSASIRYDRGVGYFSSGWLRTVSVGIVQFAANHGRMRLITSPILDADDWEAIQLGDQANQDSRLHSILARNIDDLGKSLNADTLSALAWMIADGILAIRLALPVNKLAGGEFHTKFGIFFDADGNKVSFEGSNNETVRGVSGNFERFKVFCSWKTEHKDFVDADVAKFVLLWENRDPNLRIFDLPEAAREQILKLRTSERPYPEPPWIEEMRLAREANSRYQRPRPYIPSSIELRGYQTDAIDAWFKANCRGLLEMATGTGKTITALAGSSRLFDRTKRLAVIIAVPYQHLVNQWAEEAILFGYQPILAYISKARWLDDLNHQILDFNGGYRDFISVIVTHTTFADQDFQAALARLQGPALLIADEAHHLGAERSRQHYPHQIEYRLALSATPDRWFDDVGVFGEILWNKMH